MEFAKWNRIKRRGARLQLQRVKARIDKLETRKKSTRPEDYFEQMDHLQGKRALLEDQIHSIDRSEAWDRIGRLDDQIKRMEEAKRTVAKDIECLTQLHNNKRLDHEQFLQRITPHRQGLAAVQSKLAGMNKEMGELLSKYQTDKIPETSDEQAGHQEMANPKKPLETIPDHIAEADSNFLDMQIHYETLLAQTCQEYEVRIEGLEDEIRELYARIDQLVVDLQKEAKQHRKNLDEVMVGDEKLVCDLRIQYENEILKQYEQMKQMAADHDDEIAAINERYENRISLIDMEYDTEFEILQEKLAWETARHAKVEFQYFTNVEKLTADNRRLSAELEILKAQFSSLKTLQAEREQELTTSLWLAHKAREEEKKNLEMSIMQMSDRHEKKIARIRDIHGRVRSRYDDEVQILKSLGKRRRRQIRQLSKDLAKTSENLLADEQIQAMADAHEEKVHTLRKLLQQEREDHFRTEEDLKSEILKLQNERKSLLEQRDEEYDLLLAELHEKLEAQPEWWTESTRPESAKLPMVVNTVQNSLGSGSAMQAAASSVKSGNGEQLHTKLVDFFSRRKDHRTDEDAGVINMDEKRSAKRFPVNLSAILESPESIKPRKVSNISNGGCFINLPKSMEPESPIRFRLSLDLGQGIEEIGINGRVTFSVDDQNSKANGGTTGVGVEMTDFPTENDEIKFLRLMSQIEAVG